MEYAVKGETLEGATVILCRGFASVEDAEDHRVKLALFKRVWVEQIETNEPAAPLMHPTYPP
jgi:hypothetical protein